MARLMPEPNTGCWLWDGSWKPNGYGEVNYHRRLWYVHRLVYELLRGPIPAGYTLDHLCRVRPCGNPAHLEVVSLADNIRRGNRLRRRVSGA